MFNPCLRLIVITTATITIATPITAAITAAVAATIASSAIAITGEGRVAEGGENGFAGE